MAELDYIIAPLREHAMSVDDLKVDPANANTHPERNMQAIRDSLDEFGQRQVLVARKDTHTVIAGNGRLEAARQLGWSHVACVLVDDDDITALRYAIADNRSGELSEWDGEVLARTLQAIGDGYGSLDGTGFEGDELDDLLSELEGDVDLDDAPDAQIDRAEELRENGARSWGNCGWRASTGYCAVALWMTKTSKSCCGTHSRKCYGATRLMGLADTPGEAEA